MSRYFKYPIAWLIVLGMCSYANGFTISQETVQSVATGVQTQEDSKLKPPVNTGASVISIIVDRIDSNRIYAKDGRSFPITDSTNFINNHNQKAKVKTGELFFQNGNLVTVIIK